MYFWMMNNSLNIVAELIEQLRRFENEKGQEPQDVKEFTIWFLFLPFLHLGFSLLIHTMRVYNCAFATSSIHDYFSISENVLLAFFVSFMHLSTYYHEAFLYSLGLSCFDTHAGASYVCSKALNQLLCRS